MKKRFKINTYQLEKKDLLNSFYTNNFRFALFPNDSVVSYSIIEGWQYEPYMFDFLNRNQIDCREKTIVDVGANNGSFTVDFANLVGDKGSVYSFEPQRIIYYQLCCNVFLNGLDNVYCHNIAIGNMNSFTMIQKFDYFEKGEVNFGAAEIVKDGGDKVEIRTLDSYNLKDVILIKIDVQGYESYVIDGAIKTINEYRPYMFIEFEDHLLKKQGSSENDLKNKIEKLGYVVKRFNEGMMFNTHSGKCLDCVAIPKEKYDNFNYIIP